jgi:hypothetical protein
LRQNLRRLLPVRGKFQELLLPINRTASALNAGRKSQHGCYSQIPASHRGKPVLCVTRNPLERLASKYTHGFWRDHPPGDLLELKKLLPAFPRLSFEDYLEMEQSAAYEDVRQGASIQADVGACTLHFIRFFYPDPDVALARLTDESIDSGEFLRGMPEIHFLHTESLVPELRAFLHSAGFEQELTAFLEDKPPVNCSPSSGEGTRREYFTPQHAEQYRQSNRLLFQMFPEYDEW